MMRGSEWLKRLTEAFGPEAESWHDRDPGAPLSESDRFLVEALPFERVAVGGNQAVSLWRRLRAERGAYPLIAGGEEDLIRIVEQWGREEEALASAERLQEEIGVVSGSALLPAGDWPDAPLEAPPGPELVRDPLTGDPLERVTMLLVPAPAGAEAIALLRWGGWNLCPPPERIAETLRRWERDHGAQLVALGGDSMDLEVARPPASRAAAIALAEDQLAFCPDLPDQGFESVAELAAFLMEARWWHFWWD